MKCLRASRHLRKMTSIPEIHLSMDTVGNVLCVLFGALMAVFGVLSLWKSFTVKGWRPAEGIILRSRVRSIYGHRPVVRYRYSFGGLRESQRHGAGTRSPTVPLAFFRRDGLLHRLDGL